MRETEVSLIALNLSSDLKVASYDLLLARPDVQQSTIYECAETLEEMLKSIDEQKRYKNTTRKPKKVVRRRIEIDHT